MSRLKIMVSVDNEVMAMNEAAEFLELTKGQLLGNLSRNNNSFKYKGFTVKRLTPEQHRNGTRIICAKTRKEWPSIKVFCKAFNLNQNQVEAAIKTDQRVEVNGNTYFAPDYKVIHRASPKDRAKCIKIDDKVKQTLQSIEVPKQLKAQSQPQVQKEVAELSAEVRAIKALRELAIDKIKQAAYDKVAIVIQALQLLEGDKQ